MVPGATYFVYVNRSLNLSVMSIVGDESRILNQSTTILPRVVKPSNVKRGLLIVMN